ncbi:unnamed protein product [Closterium sp. NIES-53]
MPVAVHAATSSPFHHASPALLALLALCPLLALLATAIRETVTTRRGVSSPRRRRLRGDAVRSPCSLQATIARLLSTSYMVPRLILSKLDHLRS